jgi:hypothetical protein
MVEQDHRFVRRHMQSGLRFGAFATAQRTIQGHEAMPMLCKGQLEGMAFTGYPRLASPLTPVSFCNTTPIAYFWEKNHGEFRIEELEQLRVA